MQECVTEEPDGKVRVRGKDSIEVTVGLVSCLYWVSCGEPLRHSRPVRLPAGGSVRDTIVAFSCKTSSLPNACQHLAAHLHKYDSAIPTVAVSHEKTGFFFPC